MNVLFYIAAAVAVLSTLMVITRAHAVHALLYFVVSLFSLAVIFFLLGAPFAAALEIIIYAGAIIVLFVFVVMLLDIGPASREDRARLRAPGVWVGPVALALILAVELAIVSFRSATTAGQQTVGPKQVGLSLFGPYLLGVELASFLLLAGLVGAYHLGRREPPAEEGRR